MTKEQQERIEHIKEQMCDYHCRWPGEYRGQQDLLYLEICEACPLNLLEEIIEGDK